MFKHMLGVFGFHTSLFHDLTDTAYRRSPVGVNPKPENCVFVPIPCELRFNDAERSGRECLRVQLLLHLFRTLTVSRSRPSHF